MRTSAAGPASSPESRTGVGWGCALADLDNDGWPDLVVVNGHVDNNLLIGGRVLPQAEPPKVWRNLGEGRFRAVRDAGPFFTSDHVARGAAFGDLDNDGDIDAVVSLMDRRPAVLLNESPDRSWIRLELLTGSRLRPAVGAAVEVHAGGRIIRRLAKGGGSYLSSQDPRLLIGLGSACRVDRVVIHWPDGATLDPDQSRVAADAQGRRSGGRSGNRSRGARAHARATASPDQARQVAPEGSPSAHGPPRPSEQSAPSDGKRAGRFTS